MIHDREVLAIDIGGGTTKLGSVSVTGTVSRRRSFPTLAESGDAFLDFLVREIAALREGSQTAEAPAGIGVAVAGFLNSDGDALLYNSNLPWLEGVPIARVLQEKVGIKVHLEVDSNAACLAEYQLGCGRGAKRFLCLTGGTGLGVGMVIDGELLRFAYGCMGDAGHIIIEPEGLLCTCGGRGCAEAMLSTKSLAVMYGNSINKPSATFRQLLEAAQAADPIAIALIKKAGHWLGLATASLSTIFFPDRIAIAGGLATAGNTLLTAVEQTFRASGGKFPVSQAALSLARTGSHATLVGAACYFFQGMQPVTESRIFQGGLK